MPTVTASPASALVDDDVSIVIGGLEGHQAVTVVSILKEEKVKMMSYAHFEADDDGVVDVTTMPSIGGSYEGIEPMGFIWAMTLTPDQTYGTRLMKRNVLTPINVDVMVYNGHFVVNDPERIDDECLATVNLQRWYISEDVERIEIRRGRMVATLFVPKGPGLFPGVLDLFGSIGGLVEYRASLLASRGFVTLALAYYWPPKVMVQDLEYFEEAVDFLASHPKVIPGGVGAVGVSKGAELANLISIITHKVRAVVAINGPPFPIANKQTYKGESFIPTIIAEPVPLEGGIRVNYEEDPEKIPNLLPIERSKAKHLLIHGGDDGSCPTFGTKMLPQRMVDNGRSIKDCRAVIYPDAGHLIEPPHSPHFRTSLNKHYNTFIIWGGKTRAHARAQEDCWSLIQDFLRTTLTTQTKVFSRL